MICLVQDEGPQLCTPHRSHMASPQTRGHSWLLLGLGAQWDISSDALFSTPCLVGSGPDGSPCRPALIGTPYGGLDHSGAAPVAMRTLLLPGLAPRCPRHVHS